jgi:hypothetical protein
MSNTPDLASRIVADGGLVDSTLPSCVTSDNGSSELLPLSPFSALRYHFGMLLGVDDFETEQAYHRAKMRIHNAWLHRAGVVWGFGVKVDLAHGEIRVLPGLALDAAGHELHLEADACINVADWFDKHEKDAGFSLKRDGFDVHVAIRFKACLTRQVPALLEPCENASTGTAYSRVFETIEILLRPGPAPAPTYPYHRLRLLFGVDAPKTLTQAKLDELKNKESAHTIKPDEQALLDAHRSDQEVLDKISEVRGLPATDQPAAWMLAFHRLAALDEIDLRPAVSEDGERTLLFPGRDDEPVVLANITALTLTMKDGGWVLGGGTLDTSVRPSHVATTTIQDLLCGLRGGAESLPPLGPRLKSFTIEDKLITLIFDQELDKRTVHGQAFSVAKLSDDGWKVIVEEPDLYKPDTVQLKPKNKALSFKGFLRLVVRGTGVMPLLGTNKLPLAGAVTGKPAPAGTDYVHMEER